MTVEQAEAYRQRVLASLRTCRGLHYAGKKSNTSGILTFVTICRSIGLSYDEYDQLCQSIADPDSQLKMRETRISAWTGWTNDHIKRETRDKFISDYGGVPVSNIQPRASIMLARTIMQDLKKEEYAGNK